MNNLHPARLLFGTVALERPSFVLVRFDNPALVHSHVYVVRSFCACLRQRIIRVVPDEAWMNSTPEEGHYVMVKPTVFA